MMSSAKFVPFIFPLAQNRRRTRKYPRLLTTEDRVSVEDAVSMSRSVAHVRLRPPNQVDNTRMRRRGSAAGLAHRASRGPMDSIFWTYELPYWLRLNWLPLTTGILAGILAFVAS